MRIQQVFARLIPEKLQPRMVLLNLLLVLFMAAVGGGFSLFLISTILEDQIGARALKVAQTVALIPEVREDLLKADLATSRIQEIAEAIRRTTGAEFVVVGDREGRRYSHPVAERLGKKMVGGDNFRALGQGLSYVSQATGTLGPSIRGKVPVFDADRSIIGIVSVGYLVDDVNSMIKGYHFKMLAFLAAVCLFGVALTLIITNEFKRAIFGLEPAEIAALLRERTTTLETIREGVMAVDERGRITTVNQAAMKTLGIPQDADVVGLPVREVFPRTGMLRVLESGKSELDKILLLDDKEIVVNRIPMLENGRVTGVVSSFRDRDELDRLTQKLSQAERYTEMLRAQTHEYSNKLHTISGLIQIGAHQEAVELIGSETSGYQDLIQVLMHIVPDPLLAGVILGKYNRARELKIDFRVDPDSSMQDIPSHMQREKLVTVLGNILDNCFEAVVQAPERPPVVTLSMTDLGRDLVFEFDDSGIGVSEELVHRIFTKGYSTKGGRGHGMGLFLVERNLASLGGAVSVGDSDLGGASFTVIIPKQRRAGEHEKP